MEQKTVIKPPTLLMAIELASTRKQGQTVQASFRHEDDGSVTISNEALITCSAAELWQLAQNWKIWSGALLSRSDLKLLSGGSAATLSCTKRHELAFETVAAIPSRILVFRLASWPDYFWAGAHLSNVTWIVELCRKNGMIHVRLTSTGFKDDTLGKKVQALCADTCEALLRCLQRRCSPVQNDDVRLAS